ncbi:MAG: hypothetical protein EBS05_22175 [Proteobacteria bacterium]|nr:hypothetical protein [Pseudomonadota bacterium]
MSTSESPSPMPPALAAIRSNKVLLFLLAGALGGAAGAVLAEFAPATRRGDPAWKMVIVTGIWSAIAATVLASTLFAAGEWHQRRNFRPRQLQRILLFGTLAGFLSGTAAQAAYSIEFGSELFQETVVRVIYWALMGALLGTLLSRPVPNLGLLRGFCAGTAGGGLGGIGFLLVSAVLPDAIGRAVGIGTLGLALGLAMIVVEKLFREACLEVIWAPNETTNFNLGAQAVTIGGGEDHVFVRGLPHRFASIVFTNGLIEYVETASGARTPLKNGSRLEIGKLNLVIHAAK